MVRLEVKGVRHDRMRFDVTLTGPDVVAETRLHRDVLRIVLAEFRRTGRIQVRHLEADVPDMPQRTRMIEMAEAVMREEIL